MTESLKGTAGFASGAAPKTEWAGSAIATAAPAAVLVNSRRFISSSSRFSNVNSAVHFDSGRAQQFAAHILEHVHRPLDTYFAGENRVFVLDAENPLVADLHVSTHDLFPGVRAVPISNRTEGFRGLRQLLSVKCEVQDTVLSNVVLEHHRVLHVRME